MGFMLALGELRAHFGLQIAFLATEYGLDIEDELAQIVPPELRGESTTGETYAKRKRVRSGSLDRLSLRLGSAI
jgi:hypothetical protein